MKAKKQTKPMSNWVETSAQEFLGISDTDAAVIEVRLSLALALKDFRTASRMTQAEAAKRLGSSQSRVAKMEAADPSVTIDLLIRGLLKFGADMEDIAQFIAPRVTEGVKSQPEAGVHVTSQRRHFAVPWASRPVMTSVFEKFATCKSVNGLPV